MAYDLHEVASEMRVPDDQLDRMIKDHETTAGSRAPEEVRETSRRYVSALKELRQLRQSALFGGAK